jgi:hypothetical protein
VTDRQVQPPLDRQPRLEQVGVDVSQRHRPHGRVGRRPLAPADQQHPLGRRLQLVGAHQEVDPGDLAHRLGRDE